MLKVEESAEMASEDSGWERQGQVGGEAGSSAFSKLSLNVNAAEFVPSFGVKSEPSLAGQ